MNFLNNIDWNNHDGVNFPMINDFMRNQFYDQVLKNNVDGRRCVDIGFGTGLLSLIALKYGASHVTAYESDFDRFQLGQHIITQLGLTNQITLLNQRFSNSTELLDAEVVFSETVNGNLWNEGLFNSLPRRPGCTFLPGNYFLEIWAVPVPVSFAQGLRKQYSGRCFAPGIDISNDFVQLLNQLTDQPTTSNDSELPQGVLEFVTQQETDWGWIPYMRAAVGANCVVASYSLNANNLTVSVNNSTSTKTTPLDFSVASYQLEVDTNAWQDQTVILVPRAGMSHGTHRLYLDTGHWGPTNSPVILHNVQQTLIVDHNIKTGIITYSPTTTTKI